MEEIRKPIAQTDKNTGVCPRCESLVFRFEGSEKREVLYCKWCGQKLLWSDNEPTEGITGYMAFSADTMPCGGYYAYAKCEGKDDLGELFFTSVSDCLREFQYEPNLKIMEVLVYGEITIAFSYQFASEFKIIREVPRSELVRITNTCSDCTGLGNTGRHNSGNFNTGEFNSGRYNTGDYNSGNANTGDYNRGVCNTGDNNKGHHNSDDFNIGDWNSGFCNEGNNNSGDYNFGEFNSGLFNTGDYNTGACNSGDYNSGSFNACDCSVGFFNTKPPKIYMFNKPTSYTYKEFRLTRAFDILQDLLDFLAEVHKPSDMTEEEKQNYPGAAESGGLPIAHKLKDRAPLWWETLNDEQRSIITSMPNFDKKIFRQITGINVGKKEVKHK